MPVPIPGRGGYPGRYEIDGCAGGLLPDGYNSYYRSEYNGCKKVQMLDLKIIEAQIDAVMSDFPVTVVKTGMLGSAEIIKLVAAKLKQYGIKKVVLDPVMVAKSGDLLLEKGAQTALLQELFPLASIITPNIPEAEVLCGRSLDGPGALKEAARILHAAGSSAVLLKGGHAQGKRMVEDILFDGERYYYFRAPVSIQKIRTARVPCFRHCRPPCPG